MALIVDYVKQAIRDKIEMRTRVTQDGKIVRDQASEAMLQNIPVYVQQAVVDLQRDNLLPPIVKNYTALDVKEEQRSIDDTVQYNYLKLPTDFRELRELLVGDTAYQAADSWFYMSSRYAKDSIARYTILLVDDDSDQQPRPRLVLYPYPQDETQIQLKYYVDGTETSLRLLDSRYNNAVLKKVEQYLGLTDAMSAQSEINEIASQNMNMRGTNPINSSPARLKPKYFGR